jgi:hypothetical protein
MNRKSNKSLAASRQSRPLKGYPVSEPFTSIDAIRAYLIGDKVACLLCGREYVALGGHITTIHNITSEEYKLRFGIPLKYGLAGKTFRLRGRRHIRAMRRTGRLPPAPSQATMRKMWRARLNRRPVSEATRRENLDKIRRIHGIEKFWQPRDFEEFFRRIMSGRTLDEVGKDKDMPGRAAFTEYLKKDAKLRKRYEDLWDRLPFALQARFRKSGERYKRTLVRQRLSGKTWAQVAQSMGVAAAALRSMWHTLKRTGKLRNYR